MDTCGIIAPRQNGMIGYREDDYFAECILETGHLCPHIIRTPEGKYFQWEDDFDCDCCSFDEDDRCYIYSEITEAEANKFIEERE